MKGAAEVGERCVAGGEAIGDSEESMGEWARDRKSLCSGSDCSWWITKTVC